MELAFRRQRILISNLRTTRFTLNAFYSPTYIQRIFQPWPWLKPSHPSSLTFDSPLLEDSFKLIMNMILYHYFPINLAPAPQIDLQVPLQASIPGPVDVRGSRSFFTQPGNRLSLPVQDRIRILQEVNTQNIENLQDTTPLWAIGPEAERRGNDAATFFASPHPSLFIFPNSCSQLLLYYSNQHPLRVLLLCYT